MPASTSCPWPPCTSGLQAGWKKQLPPCGRCFSTSIHALAMLISCEPSFLPPTPTFWYWRRSVLAGCQTWRGSRTRTHTHLPAPERITSGSASSASCRLLKRRWYTSEMPKCLPSSQPLAQHKRICAVATHPLPPGGRDYSRWRNDQLEQLPDFIRSPLPILLLGDLNVTPWNYHFRRLLDRTGLRDSAKGYGVQPTWPSYNPLLRIPIDHCLHSADIAIVDRRVGQSVSSDHYPVIVDFVISRERTKKGPTTPSTRSR